MPAARNDDAGFASSGESRARRRTSMPAARNDDAGFASSGESRARRRASRPARANSVFEDIRSVPWWAYALALASVVLVASLKRPTTIFDEFPHPTPCDLFPISHADRAGPALKNPFDVKASNGADVVAQVHSLRVMGHALDKQVLQQLPRATLYAAKKRTCEWVWFIEHRIDQIRKEHEKWVTGIDALQVGGRTSNGVEGMSSLDAARRRWDDDVLPALDTLYGLGKATDAACSSTFVRHKDEPFLAEDAHILRNATQSVMEAYCRGTTTHRNLRYIWSWMAYSVGAPSWYDVWDHVRDD